MKASPRIGITARNNTREHFDRLVRNYWWAITLYGGEPLILAPETALPPDEQIAQLDGLILSGGGDVHPKHYGQPLNGADPEAIREERDAMELPLTRAALAADLPILAVCRGIQVLNVAAGGSLIQHVENHRSFPDRTRHHDVDLLPGTKLAHILQTDGLFTTNSFHHQAFSEREMAPGFRAAATSSDELRLVEAMIGENWRWVVGVQWHPERFYELGPAHRRLFSELVAAAGETSAKGTRVE